MNIETTDDREFRGWVLYDGDCRLCVGLAGHVQAALEARHFSLLPLQTSWIRERLGITGPELLAEMRLLQPDGTVLGGADAVLEIGRHFWLVWPIYQLGKIPVFTKLFHGGYRWIARHRHCAAGACDIQPGVVKRSNRRLFDFLPLIFLPLLAVGFRTQLAPWVFMWAMALALYAGCKWLTYCRVDERRLTANRKRRLGYLLLWPGMDATQFLDPQNIPPQPRGIDWVPPLSKILLGLILLEGLARRTCPNYPLLAGWIGMTGIVLILHFGLFHLLALLWQRAGVRATPLMQNPLRATSLADFWGARWNTAFNELAFRFAYRPIRRRVTPQLATLAVFGISELIHELVISLPAGAGYGLPTGYFLVQGTGVVFERTHFAKRIGLDHGARGWLFTMLVTVGPVCWLFHPPFIHYVILPMLKAIGAL